LYRFVTRLLTALNCSTDHVEEHRTGGSTVSSWV